MSEIQQSTKSKIPLLSSEFVFFLNGIASLLGWNAVLSSLDYFQYVYSDYNVYSWFPIPVFIAYAIVGVLFNSISKKYSYGTLIKVGLIITNISLLLLLVWSLVLKDDQQAAGYWLCLLNCFTIGFGGNLAQLSFFAMINYLSSSAVSKFTIGTAISGLFVNVIRILIISIAGTEQSNITPIIIYFLIAILYNVFDLFINIGFMNTDLYKNSIEIHSPSFNHHANNEISQKASYLTNMIQTAKAISPFNWYLIINYIITFTLFPGPTVKKSFEWSAVWPALIFITCYNIGDTLGKTIADYRGTFNNWSVGYALLSRIYFFLTITVMANGQDKGDSLIDNNFFPFFNQLIFGLTNGFVTNACFILCFENAPIQYKKYAGVMGGLCLQFGIVIGTFTEIAYQKIAID